MAQDDDDLAWEEEEEEDDTRRTQLLQDAALGAGDAPPKKGAQAFRTNPGLLGKVHTRRCMLLPWLLVGRPQGQLGPICELGALC